MNRFFAHSTLIASACIALLGCQTTGSGGGGTTAGKDINQDVVYDPPATLNQWIYTLQRDDGTSTTVTARVAGTKTIGGQTYARLQVGKLPTMDNDPTANYVEVWGQPQGTAVVVAGGEIHNGALSLPPGTPDITLTIQPPVTVETNVPVGVPQSITGTGSLIIGDPATTAPVTGTQTGTFQLVTKNETVETGLGTQTGAAHYSGEVTVMGQKATGSLWTVSGTGVVKAEGSWPGLPGNVKGVGLGLAGTGGQVQDGDHTIASQESVLSAGNSTFKLDTYDLEGGIYADKMTHANMLLEIRWADDAKAKTAEQPSVNVEFGTTMGYFPSNAVDSPVSLLHPEENGKGYHFWTWLVNQAAKNEPGDNTTTYHIRATYSGSSPIRATGELNWHSLKPN